MDDASFGYRRRCRADACHRSPRLRPPEHPAAELVCNVRAGCRTRLPCTATTLSPPARITAGAIGYSTSSVGRCALNALHLTPKLLLQLRVAELNHRGPPMRTAVRQVARQQILDQPHALRLAQ